MSPTANQLTGAISLCPGGKWKAPDFQNSSNRLKYSMSGPNQRPKRKRRTQLSPQRSSSFRQRVRASARRACVREERGRSRQAASHPQPRAPSPASSRRNRDIPAPARRFRRPRRGREVPPAPGNWANALALAPMGDSESTDPGEQIPEAQPWRRGCPKMPRLRSPKSPGVNRRSTAFTRPWKIRPRPRSSLSSHSLWRISEWRPPRDRSSRGAAPRDTPCSSRWSRDCPG